MAPSGPEENVAASPKALSRPGSRQGGSRQTTAEGRARSKARVDQFLERQSEPSPQNQIRRDVSVLQRNLVNELRDEDNKNLLGARGVQGFTRMLTGKYGSVAAAWRIGLDRDGNGKLSFGELSQCCREMGFTGNLRKLWTELDADQDGFISLDELDPVAAQELDDFRMLCYQKFGNTLNAWTQGINPESLQGVKGVDEKVFTTRCADMGFTGDAKRLFKLLRTEWGRKDLRIEDFDPQTAAALLRADPCAESISFGGGRKAFSPPMPKAPLTPLAMSRSNTAPGGRRKPSRGGTGKQSASLTLPPSSKLEDSVGDGVGDPWSIASAPATPSRRSFAAMSKKSPPPLLDLETSTSDIAPMPSLQSSKGLSRTGTPSGGRYGELATPTRNSGFIRECSLAQILDLQIRKEDQERADKGMQSKEHFLKQLTLLFGTVRKAWFQVLDPYDIGKVGFQDFCERMRAVGYLGDMKDCWKALGGEKEGVLRLVNLDPASDKLMKDFRATLVQRHGNMLLAWQKGFDPHGFTMIDESTFVKQCVQDGVEGDHVQIFHNLKENASLKYITLREFDLAASQALARDDTNMMIEADSHGKPSPLDLSFDERQAGTFSIRWSRAQSVVARSVLASTAQLDHSMDKGCEDLGGLKAMLLKKFGNLAVAWRVALDPLGQGHLSFEDFCVSIRSRVGFSGDLRTLWSEVAKPNSGHISLHDLDPVAAEALWSFRAFLLETYGDLMNAWKLGLDPNAHGKLQEQEFIAKVAELGFQGDGNRLFQLLVAEPHKKYIVLRDLDPAAAQAFFRGDNHSLTLYGKQSGPSASPRHWTAGKPPSSPSKGEDEASPSSSSQLLVPASPPVHRNTRITLWSGELGHRKRKGAVTRANEEIQSQLGAKSLSGYRKLLVGLFGSLVAAWRYELDPDCTGRLTYVQFMMAIERVGGYTGSLIKLWNEFDTNNLGEATLKDLDPAGFELLKSFCKAACAHSGTLRGFWGALDDEALGRVDEECWIKRCLDLALEDFVSERKLARIFKLLLPVPVVGRGRHVVEEDLQACLLALPPTERLPAWNGEMGAFNIHSAADAMMDSNRPKTPSTPATNEGNAAGMMTSEEMRPSTAGETNRERLAKCSPELPVTTPEDFRRILKRLYGSVYAGWVKYLDVTEVGRVPKGEFVNRARAIGVTGHVAALFEEIDVDKKGFITLKDIDPEVSAAVKQFIRCAEAKYVSLEKAWAKAFNVSKRIVVGQDEFVKGCEDIGYKGDAEKLFEIMRPESGRPFLEIQDFGRHASKTVKAYEDI